MKRRAIFSLVVFVFSGIWLTGCAAPRSPGDTEARLQNLENKVASYSGLSARVDALEKAAREKGLLEPALSTENLPPPEYPVVEQNPHSDFVVSAVPGQKEVTTAPAPQQVTAGASVTGRPTPETKTPAPAPTPTPAPPVIKENSEPAPAPPAAKQEAPPAETSSPFTAKQAAPPQDTPSPFSAQAKPPTVEAKERQAQTTEPPLPQLDNTPKTQAQAQSAAQAQPKPEAAPQTTAQNQPPPAPTPAPTPAPAPKPTPKPAPTTEKGTYEAALALYESGKYADSRKAMAGFLETYPASAYVPNALYWIGESHYSQSRWDQAILSFKDVVARFPKHAKAADALLKLGMSYEQLKDKDNARFHYEALIEDFPASRAAGLAKQKLAKL